jgi:hypothetical protein
MTEFDKAEADFLSKTSKVITDTLRWRVVGERRWRLEAKVLAPDAQQVLKLSASIGRTNYGFVLLFENHPFRKLTYHHRHTKPNGQVILGELHKHIWSQVYEDRDCYIPTDIDQAADVNEILLGFLKEENVQLAEPYQHVIFE